MPIDSPSRRYTTPAITRARKKKDAALTRLKQCPSYKGVLTTLLTSNANDPSTSKDTLPLAQLPPLTNGECIANPESEQAEDNDAVSDENDGEYIHPDIPVC